MQVRHRRRSAPVFVKVLITIISLAGISLAVALVWQNAEESLIAPDLAKSGASSKAVSVSDMSGSKPDIPGPETESPDVAPATAPQSEVSAIKTASEAALDAAENQGEALPAASDGYAREAVPEAVPPSKAVEYSYFDDAIFFGDSISTGIPLYMKTMVPGTAVIAVQGAGPGSVNTSQCIDVDGTRVTMLEAAKTKGERKKVYIMLGANSLDSDEKSFIEGYAEFLQSIKSLYPEAVIYVQSMLPVTSAVNNVYPSKSINNPHISELNEAIRKMALEQGANYVDVAQCMVDENGMLPQEASPLDGMHLTAEYYIKWFDYLRTHTVAAKK